jgi:hypothetical protein
MQLQITSCSLRFSLSLSLHSAPQARLLDPSPRNATWNLCCCGLASKFLYHNETSAIESRESLFRWQQQSGIDETAQTVIVVVTRVPCTCKHHLLGHPFPSPRSPEPRSAIFYSCVRTTKWRASRQSRRRRRRKRKETTIHKTKKKKMQKRCYPSVRTWRTSSCR